VKTEWKRLVLPLVGEMFFLVLTAWTFFDFSALSFALVIYIPFAVKKCVRNQKEKSLYELSLAFKDALACMENAMAVGYSPESAIRETVKELAQLYGEQHRLCMDFQKIVKQMELGVSLEQAFAEFAKQSEAEDICLLAELFQIAKRTGGNLAQVFRQTQGVLQEKIDLKRELRTMIASKHLEFQVMCQVPYGILIYLKLCAPSMSRGLYDTGAGVLFMSGAFLWYLLMRALGEQVIRREAGGME